MRALVLAACLGLCDAGRTLHGLPQRPEDLLHATVRDGTDLELLQELIDIGTDVNDGGYEDGARSPLMWACFKGKTHIVKMLLEGGAKVNWQDSYGSTALSFAVNARKGTDTEGEQLDPRTDKPASYHITKLLLEHEADPNLADEEGKNSPPLHFALSAGAWDMALLLIEGGANVNFGLHNKLYGQKGGLYGPGSTAVHMALGEGEVDIVEAVFKHGADLELRNEMGELPVDRVMDSTKKKAIMKLVVRAPRLHPSWPLSCYLGALACAFLLDTTCRFAQLEASEAAEAAKKDKADL